MTAAEVMAMLDTIYPPQEDDGPAVPVGYFTRNYPQAVAQGRGWLRHVPAVERKALARVANAASGYGSLGGRARAASAQRDARGRFVSNGGK